MPVLVRLPLVFALSVPALAIAAYSAASLWLATLPQDKHPKKTLLQPPQMFVAEMSAGDARPLSLLGIAVPIGQSFIGAELADPERRRESPPEARYFPGEAYRLRNGEGDMNLEKSEHTLSMDIAPGLAPPIEHRACTLQMERKNLGAPLFRRYLAVNRFCFFRFDFPVCPAGKCLHLPMQKRLNISPSKSSGVSSPVISDSASWARRNSSACNSSRPASV